MRVMSLRTRMLVVRVMSPGRSLGSCNELNRSSCAVSCRAGCKWSAGLLRDRAPNVLSHPLLSYCCPCLLLLDCEIFVCIVSGVVVCLWLLAPTPAGAGGIDPLPRILCLPADALPVVGESAGAPALAQLLLACLLPATVPARIASKTGQSPPAPQPASAPRQSPTSADMRNQHDAHTNVRGF